MAGPTLSVELAEPASAAGPGEFRALIRGLSSHFEELRHGYFDVSVPVRRLGTAVSAVVDAQEEDARPFLVCLMGPGIGDEGIFEAEHADESPEVEAILGFKPVQAVNVSAGCNRAIDHVATALLTAAVIDVLGGVVNAELSEGQESVVAGLPGVLGVTNEGYAAVVGTAEFLRAWVDRPGFRLVK